MEFAKKKEKLEPLVTNKIRSEGKVAALIVGSIFFLITGLGYYLHNWLIGVVSIIMGVIFTVGIYLLS